jgi:hypothetical protein
MLSHSTCSGCRLREPCRAVHTNQSGCDSLYLLVVRDSLDLQSDCSFKLPAQAYRSGVRLTSVRAGRELQTILVDGTILGWTASADSQSSGFELVPSMCVLGAEMQWGSSVIFVH